MMSQKTLALVKTKKRRIVVDFCPKYWAIGVGFGRKRCHMQVGPIALAMCKVRV